MDSIGRIGCKHSGACKAGPAPGRAVSGRLTRCAVWLAWLAGAVGCSWQPADLAQNAWRELRLDNTATVRDDNRWRVPQGLAWQLASLQGDAPQSWQDAAARGFARQFGPPARMVGARTDSAPWQLHVAWPLERDPCAEPGRAAFDPACQPADAVAPVARTRVDVTLFGLDQRIAERGVLFAVVTDPHGVVVKRLRLDVTPWWFGEAWRRPAQLEAAFATLASHLSAEQTLPRWLP